MREKNNLRGQKNKIRKKTSWNKLSYNSYLRVTSEGIYVNFKIYVKDFRENLKKNAQDFFLSVSEKAKNGKQEIFQVKHSGTWWMKVIDIFSPHYQKENTSPNKNPGSSLEGTTQKLS